MTARMEEIYALFDAELKAFGRRRSVVNYHENQLTPDERREG
jgi:hypothetical protein